VLSGHAEATPGAVNAIFIIDLSGSTLTVTNLDANFDGVVDSRDNINGQNNFADILDVELGSILRVTSQLAGQVDDLLVGVIPFGLASETVDLGHTLFNQTFADPAVNVNGDGATTPDYEEATRSIYNNGTTSVVDRFRAFSFNDNTNFDAALKQLIGSLEIAPQADKTWSTSSATATPRRIRSWPTCSCSASRASSSMPSKSLAMPSAPRCRTWRMSSTREATPPALPAWSAIPKT
jgi:hypothetical protein